MIFREIHDERFLGLASEVRSLRSLWRRSAELDGALESLTACGWTSLAWQAQRLVHQRKPWLLDQSLELIEASICLSFYCLLDFVHSSISRARMAFLRF